ncbi:MAG TPA: Rieske 2Fe-2S domain-containing protein [Actinomycetota bacterium]
MARRTRPDLWAERLVQQRDRARHRGRTGVVASWAAQSWPLRILRAFLGATFVYAGIQKFADPNFLHPGTPDFIGTQLQGFARGSPIHGLLSALGHVAVLTGVGIALLEIAIGLGTLLGAAPTAFAALGLAVNLSLFLSATWHVRPYFLGSDSIYAVAWLALLVGHLQAKQAAGRVPVRGTRHQRAAARDGGYGRREFLRGAVVGLGTLLLSAGATALAGTPASRIRTPRADAGRRLATRSSPSASAHTAQGTTVAKLDSVPVGGAVAFSDPATGNPAVLLRPAERSVEAFSRVCTHAGCLVQWDQADALLICPCHGAEFDPSHGGRPISGPAPTALERIPVAIDRSTGNVVVTS